MKNSLSLLTPDLLIQVSLQAVYKFNGTNVGVSEIQKQSQILCSYTILTNENVFVQIYTG